MPWLASPLSRVVPLPNGLFMGYKWALLTNLYTNWDDPPSTKPQRKAIRFAEKDELNE